MTVDPSLRVFALSGAARRASLNTKLLRVAAASLERHGATVEIATLGDFSMPVYDGDLEESSGPPQAAVRLAERIAAADAMLIASPEYNFSVPGSVKNAVDWVSRVKPNRLAGKCTQLLSASPAMVGGNRGLWALRVPLEALGARVVPDMFSLAQAHEAFTEDGRLASDSLAKRLDEMLARFLAIAGALRTIA